MTFIDDFKKLAAEEFISIAEAAKLLGINEQSLRVRLTRGSQAEPRFVRIAGKQMTTRTELAKALKQPRSSDPIAEMMRRAK